MADRLSGQAMKPLAWFSGGLWATSSISGGKTQGFVAAITTVSDQAAGTPARLPATTPCILPTSSLLE